MSNPIDKDALAKAEAICTDIADVTHNQRGDAIRTVLSGLNFYRALAAALMPVADEGLKVGDIVKVVKDRSWGSRLVGSSVGIVVAIGSGDSVLVKFEGRTDLHNGHFEGFKSKNNDCWWFKVEKLYGPMFEKAMAARDARAALKVKP